MGQIHSKNQKALFTVTDSAHFAKVYVGLENFNFSEEHEDTAA